jgi:hypothetical protein
LGGTGSSHGDDRCSSQVCWLDARVPALKATLRALAAGLSSVAAAARTAMKKPMVNFSHDYGT